LNLTFSGQSPFRFDYNEVITPSGVTQTFFNQIGTTTFPIPKFAVTDNTTYTVTRVKDFNGCESTTPVSAAVGVTKVSSAFTVEAPTAQCTGSIYKFKWRMDANTDYQWEWPDGSTDVIIANSRPPGDAFISHVLTNGLTSTSISLPVKLSVTSNCPQSTVVSVMVYPAVKAVIPSVQNVICSGTTLNFGNFSEGANTHKWFYREKGTTAENFVEATKTVDYLFTNNSIQNPIVYQVIYIGTNTQGCTDSDTLDITVYKNSIANFDVVGSIPEYVGGTATLNLTNTSSLIDATNFSYAWDFGQDSAPSGYTDNAAIFLPPEIYSSPGSKTIRLTVTNRAQAMCKSEFQNTIPIPIPPFSAAFTATPLASCLPTEIVVTNLSGKADTFSWELRDFAGNVVAKSNVNQPTFAISSGGTYAIFLTATLRSTGQTATAQITDIEVYERPHAVFDARPNPFFVPDTPIQMFTDNTTGANHYYWDFGDGGTATDEKEPSHTYKLEGSYTITFFASFDHGNKDVNGTGSLQNVTCYDTAKLVVKGRQGGQTRIPNAFTPDPSGPNGGNVTDYSRNDVFLPITRGVEEFEMQIYDRWGTMVFVSKDKNQGWDGYDRNGSLLPAGVYVFKLTMRLSNGQRTTQVGDVTLLR
jgi:gliding motility-associated-like protein